MRYDAKDTAVLLLDLQNEMTSPDGKIGSGGLAKAVEERDVLGNAARLLEAARKTGAKVVHVRLGFRSDYLDSLSVAPRIQKLKENGAAKLGEWGTEFPDAVAPRDGELVVTKQCVNPFFNTGLLNWLMQKGVKRVVLSGVVTNLVVEASARYCDDAGFTVTVVEDACAAPNAAWHDFAMQNTLPLFGEVVSTRQVVERLNS